LEFAINKDGKIQTERQTLLSNEQLLTLKWSNDRQTD